MNYRNFMNFTALILFAYTPLRGMETTTAILGGIVQATVEYFKSPQQKAFEQGEKISQTSLDLEKTIKEFQKINKSLKLSLILNTISDSQPNQILQKQHSQHKKYIQEKVVPFINIINEYDTTLRNNGLSSREQVLEKSLKVLDNDVIKKKEIIYLIKTVQEIRDITIKNIENKINNNSMESSAIQLNEHMAKNDPNRWPNTAEEQIQYIDELEISNNLKTFFLQIFWDKNKQDKKDNDRRFFGYKLRELKASIPTYTDIYLKDEKKSVSLPLFILKANHPPFNTLDALNINETLKTIITTQQKKALEVEQQYNDLIFNEITDILYPTIKEYIKNNIAQPIETLVKHRKQLNTCITLLEEGKVKQDWSKMAADNLKYTISKTRKNLDQIILKTVMSLHSEFNSKTMKSLSLRDGNINIDTLHLINLINYQNKLSSYIKDLPDDTLKEQLVNYLNSFSEQIQHLKETASQEKLKKEMLQKEALEKAEREKLEKETLEQERLKKEQELQEREAQEKIKQQKLEQKKKIQELAEREKLEKEKLEQKRLEKEQEAIQKNEAQKKIDQQKLEQENNIQATIEKNPKEQKEIEKIEQKEIEQQTSLNNLSESTDAIITEQVNSEDLKYAVSILPQNVTPTTQPKITPEIKNEQPQQSKIKEYVGAISLVSIIAILLYNLDLLKNLLLSVNTDTLRNLLHSVKLY